MKNIVVLFDFPKLTVEEYKKTWDDLRATGHAEPKGLIHHTGARNGSGLTVVEVWESEEAFAKFGTVLMPVLKKNGFPDAQPRILLVAYAYESKRKPCMHNTGDERCPCQRVARKQGAWATRPARVPMYG